MVLHVFVYGSCSGVVGKLAEEALCFVGVAWGFVIGVRVGCRVVLVIICAQALPRWFWLWGGYLLAVPGGFPFVLCPIGDLLHEIRELACLRWVEL